jgi:hypothetical protein
MPQYLILNLCSSRLKPSQKSAITSKTFEIVNKDYFLAKIAKKEKNPFFCTIFKLLSLKWQLC